jgi:hypothetical protein
MRLFLGCLMFLRDLFFNFGEIGSDKLPVHYFFSKIQADSEIIFFGFYDNTIFKKLQEKNSGALKKAWFPAPICGPRLRLLRMARVG